MKVLLDINSLVAKQLTGIGIYIQQLGLQLSKVDELEVLGSLKLSRILKKSLVSQNTNLPIVMEELALLLARKNWIYHGGDFRIPRTRRLKKVITVHDLVTFRTGLVDPKFEKSGQEELRVMLEEHKPDHILVNSEFTKTELLEFFPQFINQVSITPLAFDHQIVSSKNQSPSGISNFQAPAFPYFLFIGTLENRKNLPRILSSFLKFRHKHPDFKLILIGNGGFGADSFQQVIAENSNAFVRPGFLPSNQTQELYKGARSLFFPSLYEGFGIPILEAMKAGCPVITSNRGAMKEVSGGAAELVDPENEDSMIASLERLATDESRRNSLRGLGQKRALDFSWKTTAQATFAAYKKLS